MSLFGRFLKRFFDILNSTISIVFFLITWAVIALIIKLQSPGPVIYKALRIGKDGKEFVCYKFRTMRVDSGDIKLTTLSNDNRIYGFGKFLRKTKLDETPQLFNILKGEMSVIGPRPEDKINIEDTNYDFYKMIISAKPGLSSPASIYDYTHGEKYNDICLYRQEFLPKKLQLEVYYIKHQSVFYDLRIIIRTIVTIVLITFGKKAFKEPQEFKKIRNEKKEAV